MEILSKLPSIIDYNNTLKRFDGVMNITLLDEDGNNFPRIRTSIAEGYKRTKWIEDAEGYMYSQFVILLGWNFIASTNKMFQCFYIVVQGDLYSR